MDVLFEATFYFSIGLLAITITVYVLAVTLLGKAIKISINEKKAAEEKKKEEVGKQIEKLQSQLEGVKQSDFNEEQIKKFNADIKLLRRKQQSYSNKIAWIQLKPQLLTATNGAFFPAFVFILAIGISVWGRYLYYINQKPEWDLFWSVFVLLFIGILSVGSILKAIEEITVVSEEVALSRQKEIQIEAMRDFESSLRPELTIDWGVAPPPFYMSAASTSIFKIGIKLVKGDYSENTFIQMYLPPEFVFVGITPFLQRPEEPKIGGFTTLRLDFGTVNYGLTYVSLFTVTAPSKPGRYIGYIALNCKGFYAEDITFELNVT